MVIVEAQYPAVDAVGAVVGSRGSRIEPLVAELDYENVDVVRWSDSLDQLIGNLVAPNRILEIRYDEATRQARITLQADQREPSLLNPTRLALASDLVAWKLVIE
jgi:N utilization substance protein A